MGGVSRYLLKASGSGVDVSAELKVTDLRWRTPMCNFLRFSAHIFGLLRKYAVFCGFLRPANAWISRGRGESAKIRSFLRKSAFWALSVALVPSPYALLEMWLSWDFVSEGMFAVESKICPRLAFFEFLSFPFLVFQKYSFCRENEIFQKATDKRRQKITIFWLNLFHIFGPFFLSQNMLKPLFVLGFQQKYIVCPPPKNSEHYLWTQLR